jgi:NTP pyrophosphatase (non-canonical NTP hydrolase)
MTYDEQALRTEAPPTEELFQRLDECERPIHAVFGLASEVGEFADAYKKYIFYGRPVDETNAIEEIGDILWYLAIAADSLGVTIEECQRRNIAKLRARYPERFTEADAVDRDLEAERRILEGGNGP